MAVQNDLADGLPDDARRHIDYNDIDRIVTTTSDLNTYDDNALVSKVLYDTLGRSVETRVYESGTNCIATQQQYDALGRVFKTSNPFRPLPPDNEIPLWTTTLFDGLSRLKTVTTPDNAVVSSYYNGNQVLVKDQAGKERMSQTNALGQLSDVWEITAADDATEAITFPNRTEVTAGYRSKYEYDTLGNLITVTQRKGTAGTLQTRLFVYDSLQRLTSATNPESGTVNYQYDNNGNLTRKTDARGIYVDYRVYDALNRNKTVDYSDTSTNPDITRNYDGATNGKGRLWESYAGGTYTIGSNVEHTRMQSYDALGRPLVQLQDFKSNSVWSLAYQTQRTYDLAGHVKTQNYPSGRIVTYNYDLAGRTSSFNGNIGDGVQRTYASAVTYSAFGGMQQEQFGTQTPLFHKLHYNIRGQIYDVRLSTVPWATDQWNWNRGALVLYFGYAHQQSGPLNNGNVSMMQYYVPTNDQQTIYNYTEQRYAYDPLNRLTSVAEYPGTQAGLGALSFTQIFDYDRWGNRTINPATTNAPEPQFTASSATNRLGVAVGQSGRMDYDTAGNLVNDTYTSYGRTDGLPTRLYDAENRLTTVKDGNLQVVSSYSYNADGQRTRRKLGSVETWQVYGMDGELLSEYQSGAAPYLPTIEYGYRGGQLLTTITSGDTQRLNRFVTNLYYGALQRDPTGTELQDKVNQLAAAGVVSQSQLLTTASQIARSLFTATNYETSPYRSDIQYVSDLYYAYLQRGPDGPGLNFWAGQVPGNGRANVCNAFEASGEFQTLVTTLYGTAASDNERTEHFVNNFYLGAYGRNATATELQQQRDALNAAAAQGQSQVQTQAETMGRSLFAGQVNDASLSNTQYVTNLYEGFLQRGPDAGGLGYWSGQASLGQGRQNVLNAFAAATAFRELAATLYKEVFWLVTDQLGAPRMIVNKSGSLASIKRHDYLPFGEELYAGTGGRTTTQGYSGDSVRQKFTSKERDTENGLDYFGARYYSSTQGRFTSPDPPFMDQWEYDPQSWNLYSYVRNNPLTSVDPTGNAAVPCDKICEESKRKAEEERKKAKAEGIDVEVIDMKPPAVVQVFLVYEPESVADTAVRKWREDEAKRAAWGARNSAYLNSLLFPPCDPGKMCPRMGIIFPGGFIAPGRITFSGAGQMVGHGARHLVNLGVSQAEIEAAITADIESVQSTTGATGSFWGHVTVQGHKILYRAYTLPDGTINVGTYYKP